ncbi:TetR/AcrR family transcriptional regulator [Actinoplanes xinjiangensis]|uniref:TetR/AcrR family transcriptional regulator n=1 Tax=Actinoplanes xinjiangensis TaxID=512350 RepID=UPI003442CA10
MGLRDEKKQATRTAIADAALTLFLEKGFERVTVAEVARAANVSVNTVFNYFPTKEDLFFDRQDEVTQRLAAAVRGRADGETPVAAVHRAFAERLDRDDPTLGLRPGSALFWRVVDDSPALLARARLLRERTEEALADALADPLAAALLAAADHALHAEIRRRITLGESPESVRTAVRAAAARAFTVLAAVA